jgi:alcohol dehydrogenase, propanol-preferring
VQWPGLRAAPRGPAIHPSKEGAMKAAVVHDFTQPLTIEDVPRPEPSDGQVLVRIEACGLCHTDIHAAHGDWPIKPSLPLIPGHEGVGIVEVLGPAAGEEISVGDRVAVPWLGFACGHCRYCNSGRETLCEAQINTGYGMDGGYAEYVAAYARHVVKVPDGVDSLDAAPLSCAGVTVYKAVKSSEVGPSQLCAIFGVGGLGHLAVQYAKIQGATVVAVDLEDAKLEMAKELGADYVVNAAEQDPAAEIQRDPPGRRGRVQAAHARSDPGAPRDSPSRGRSTRRSTTSSTRATRRRAWSSPSEPRRSARE